VAISPAPGLRSRSRRRLAVWAVLGAVVVLLAGLAAAVLEWSGASLTGDPLALARLSVEPLGGSLASVRAVGPDGRRIPLAVHSGRLTPQAKLSPGETVSVDVTVRRPGWLAWALGKERHERLTVRAPVASVSERWLTVARGGDVRVAFDQPVSRVAYADAGGGTRTVRDFGAPRRTVSLGRRSQVGSVQVEAAPRSWERVGAPVTVSWFPKARSAVAVASPAPGTKITPAGDIRLSFSKPVSEALGASKPSFSPAIPGRWHQPDSHTLAFTPSGFGAPLGGHVRMELPRAVAVSGPAGGHIARTRRVDWTVPPGSTLRLEQLLARAGYLPLDWTPSGKPVRRTPAAEVAAATAPPNGHFSWRYPHTPPELRALWQEGKPNGIVRGALMMFEDNHGLTADGFAGPKVWRALLQDAIAGKRRTSGYSYVYVHRNVPQSLTLWHNGHTVLSSPGNTGVPSAPTQLGTFPVFEHIPVGTMSGTNPDGSHYNDPGIRWISYFNGGDALHAFNRASFGTPQSLGCVELPLAAAAKVWPYTPIGTLVTIEN
jgi:L,D-transpeptidase-like protein